MFSDGCDNAKLLSSLCRKLPNLTVQVAFFYAEREHFACKYPPVRIAIKAPFRTRLIAIPSGFDCGR